MPQYYSNANVGSAFSDGLMAGYEFVDRIKQRRRQLELEERAQNRADRHLEIAEDANTRAAEAFDRAKVLWARQDSDYEFMVNERNRATRVRDDIEKARRDAAEGLVDATRRSTVPSLGAIATQPLRPAETPAATPAAAPAETPAATPAAAPAPAEAPAGPVDLRAAQRERDTAPGFLERLSNAFKGAKEENAKQTKASFWKAVADLNKNVEISGTRARLGVSGDPGEAPQNVRRDPLKGDFQYVDRYLAERDVVDPTARASLDLTMSNALKERKEALASQDTPAARAQLSRIDDLLNQLARSAAKTTAADAGINRPVKKDDERVVPAVVAAAAKAREVQPILETTPDELRAARALVTRADNSPRLNSRAIQGLTTLFVHGEIDAEQMTNWLRYGTPIAPKQPTVQPLGGGYAAIVSDAGVSLMRLPGAAGAAAGGGGSKESLAQQQSRLKDRLQLMDSRLKELVGANKLSEGGPAQHAARFLDMLKREGPNIQLRTGMPLFGEDGELRLDKLDIAEFSQLLDAYVEYDKGEEQRWIFKGGKSFTEYTPQGFGSADIIDLTDAF